jgi:hypothetical protein
MSRTSNYGRYYDDEYYFNEEKVPIKPIPERSNPPGRLFSLRDGRVNSHNVDMGLTQKQLPPPRFRMYSIDRKNENDPFWTDKPELFDSYEKSEPRRGILRHEEDLPRTRLDEVRLPNSRYSIREEPYRVRRRDRLPESPRDNRPANQREMYRPSNYSQLPPPSQPESEEPESEASLSERKFFRDDGSSPVHSNRSVQANIAEQKDMSVQADSIDTSRYGPIVPRQRYEDDDGFLMTARPRTKTHFLPPISRGPYYDEDPYGQPPMLPPPAMHYNQRPVTPYGHSPYGMPSPYGGAPSPYPPPAYGAAPSPYLMDDPYGPPIDPYGYGMY